MAKRKKAAFGCLIVAAVSFFSVIATVKYYTSPADKAGKTEVSFFVNPGEGASQIAQHLKEKSLVRSASYFAWCAMKSGSVSHLQAGEYKLSPSMTPNEIIAALSRAPAPETIRVTLLEGWASGRIADEIAEKGFCTKEDFMAIVRNPADAGIELPSSVSNLEGFLFPDTYDFKPDADCKAIISRLVSRFTEVFTPDLIKKGRALGLDLNGMVTLASLVEKEARVDEERETIAGVIYKRLKIGRRLEIDATYKYRNGEWLPEVGRSGTGYDHRYDTYAVAGLPPGPICNPGASALQAAVNPDLNTKFLYYVTRKDGSYGHYFNETYQEHLRDISRSRANRKRLGL